MSIRTTRKDHLPDHARIDLAVANATVIDRPDRAHDAANAQNALAATPARVETESFLVTAQSGKVFDFSQLAYGKAAGSHQDRTTYTGRYELASELMPAIRDRALGGADLTVTRMLTALLFFWRTFNDIEARAPDAPRLRSVVELSIVHRQIVVDRGLDPSAFSAVLKIFNLTRLALGEKQLRWAGPPRKGGKVKHLPSQSEVKRVKDALKRLWFAWRDKYDHAQHLLSLSDDEAQALPQGQRFILQSLRRFKDAQQTHGVALPNEAQLNPKCIDVRPDKFMGYPELCSYFFPDASAIRSAFHLCLATTGWNPAVLTSLKVDEEIFMTHPADEARYIMKGTKRRARNAEQRCDGLKKSQHGPYSIINFLTELTTPLRGQLQVRGEAIDAKLAASADLGLDAETVLVLQQERLGIEAAIRSPWLYSAFASTGKYSGFGGIQQLTDRNFANTRSGGLQFVQKIIKALNERNPEQPIGKMTATDFRDAYALHWYEFSGGDILTVMRVLNHRHVRTSVTYTNSVVVRVRNQAKARKVLKAWWREVEELGQADSTAVSFTVRHGKPSEEQRRRLKAYRTLMLTQMGTRCGDPHNPPAHVAPHFKPDGRKVCDVQRCMLCVDHAVITQESLDGIARRSAELAHIKSSVSVGTWETAAYDEEMENTELALAGFKADAAQEVVERWTRQIESGEHRVMPFESS